MDDVVVEIRCFTRSTVIARQRLLELSGPWIWTKAADGKLFQLFTEPTSKPRESCACRQGGMPHALGVEQPAQLPALLRAFMLRTAAYYSVQMHITSIHFYDFNKINSVDLADPS